MLVKMAPQMSEPLQNMQRMVDLQMLHRNVSGATILGLLYHIKYTKSDEVICIMGHLNAKVVDERYRNIVGMHGLGRRNERGERLIQFCQENKLLIANTWFQQPVRKLYTWKSSGDISRNQIDYIMFNDRFRNCMEQAKTYPGADMNFDHNPVVVKVNMKLKRTNATKRNEHLELNLLKEET